MKKSERERRLQPQRLRYVTFGKSVVTIPSLNFCGGFAKSPSGKWAICWDSGYYSPSLGKYILYDIRQEIAAAEGMMGRPNAGHVANNGTFSIEAWGDGTTLAGTFYVFSSSGSSLIAREFGANIVNSALSESGQFALCQTANSPTHHEDGNRLTAFDVGQGVELFSVHPYTGWAHGYTFAEDVLQFGVVKNGLGTFYYDMQGNFLDAEKLQAAKLHSNDCLLVLSAAENIVTSPELNDNSAAKALEASARALTLVSEDDQRSKAIALKIQGLAYEHLGNYEAAIAAFDAAIQNDSKVGVKRKLDSLRKKY